LPRGHGVPSLCAPCGGEILPDQLVVGHQLLVVAAGMQVEYREEQRGDGKAHAADIIAR
jgi:hypothetical protein